MRYSHPLPQHLRQTCIRSTCGWANPWRQGSFILHIDLNSCFATIEQQAQPPLRGKPIAVAAYTTPHGCIVAPSIEARRYGVKVGMRVKDGQLLCPQLVILPPDPNKYRHIHRLLKRLLLSYTDDVTPKSIDEFVLNLEGSPAFGRGVHNIGRQLKQRIKAEMGDYLTVSIGIGPNRWLAKTGAGLHKPDGLDEINHTNFEAVYNSLSLRDLCGIAERNAARLNSQGVFTVMDFYNASEAKLRRAFQSVLGYYWHTRLHGWEIDDVLFDRRSFGNSYSLPDSRRTPEEQQYKEANRYEEDIEEYSAARPVPARVVRAAIRAADLTESIPLFDCHNDRSLSAYR